ncbi:MAG: acetylpolyamine amidohydrolase, partial [Erythrobacter sp.]|nr:acetylpolyamine amidohydrolase [Erythrobacter sp.]
MLTFSSPRQSAHDPARELMNGGWADHAETPTRLATMLAAMDGDVRAPDDHGMAPILAVHDPDYVAFLETAHAEWLAAGREGDAIGYAFPVRGRRPLRLDRIDARLGQYSFDAGTPITAGSWDAAYWGAQAALSAVAAVAGSGAAQ